MGVLLTDFYTHLAGSSLHVNKNKVQQMNTHVKQGFLNSFVKKLAQLKKILTGL